MPVTGNSIVVDSVDLVASLLEPLQHAVLPEEGLLWTAKVDPHDEIRSLFISRIAKTSVQLKIINRQRSVTYNNWPRKALATIKFDLVSTERLNI